MLRWCYGIVYSMLDQGCDVSRMEFTMVCYDTGYSMLDQGYGIGRGDVTMLL